ncbi:ABC transporter substrate-binding protein [Nocardioides acrostichi]|uniref:ABC transporter substrate-binding protein n=1 Tax=Nocardioides acrostichi TaxID=2784339 RepID=A0A930Y6C0_9ACTN|nr:ABC transporter substrate-binding protein [Nocardioides acrostichi]MBF4160776.1 ABC transporter substrate-binding protein [Nocardioides acrostichi]
MSTTSQRRSRRTRRLLALGAATLLAAGLAACSSGKSVDLGDAGDSGDTSQGITVAIAGEPDQLDPHKTTSYFSFEVLENVYDTLVEPDENLQMQPSLAESWDVSKDQLTWTFHLRQGVMFQDGTPMTAKDVVYSFDRIIDDKLATAYRFSAVKDIKALDDDTVEIDVTAPSPNLLSSIGGFKGVAIVEKKNVTSGDITTHPVGTGPYELTDFTSGDHIDLEANPDYWGGAPSIPSIRYRFISEGSTAVAALKAGEIQWTDSIPPQQVKALQGDDSVDIDVVPSNDYWYLALNEKRKPFDDVRVRQAIAYAIDRDAIAQVTSYGTAKVNELAIPEESAWYTAYDTYSKDDDKAEQLLDEAGVKNLTMELMVSSDYPETVKAAQVIADELADVGITLKIRSLDFGTWLDEQNKGNFDMLYMGWLGNIDPDDYYYSQHHTGGSSNAQGYSNAEVDTLLDEGRTTTDETERKEIYAKAATQIADDASYIYLYNPSVIQAYSPDLSGYTVRSDRAIRWVDASMG